MIKNPYPALLGLAFMIAVFFSVFANIKAKEAEGRAIAAEIKLEIFMDKCDSIKEELDKCQGKE